MLSSKSSQEFMTTFLDLTVWLWNKIISKQ
jgi:hypothetical protein